MRLSSVVLFRSFASAIAAGTVTYVTAWGFFTTHEEVNVSPQTAWPIALAVGGIVLVFSLIQSVLGASSPQRK